MLTPLKLFLFYLLDAVVVCIGGQREWVHISLELVLWEAFVTVAES